MCAKLILFCTCLLICTPISSVIALQGPAGEVIKRPPPPVDERAAARAEQAARLRRQAAIADQVELALKNANADMHRYYDTPSSNRELGQEFLSQAEADYQRAAKLQPRDWRAFAGLGDVYYKKDRFGDSALAYKRATTLRPNDAQLFAALGQVYEKDKKLAEEIRAFARSVQIDPSFKNYAAYVSLADAYRQGKLTDNAIETYKTMLTLLPPSHTESVADVHFNLAVTNEHANRFSEAIAEYKESLRIKPDHQIYRFLGNVYVETQDYNNAVAAFRRATELDPYDFKSFGALGYAYYLQRQYALSVESLQQGIRLESGYPEDHYYLGLSQLMLGHKSEAMEQYEELKKLNSDLADKLLGEINKQ